MESTGGAKAYTRGMNNVDLVCVVSGDVRSMLGAIAGATTASISLC